MVKAFKIAAGNWMRSPNSCTKHRLSGGSVLKTQCQLPSFTERRVEPELPSEVHSEDLEKRLGEPDTVSPNVTKESESRTTLSREGNFCSMIDLLMRKDSVSAAAKER